MRILSDSTFTTTLISHVSVALQVLQASPALTQSVSTRLISGEFSVFAQLQHTLEITVPSDMRNLPAFMELLEPCAQFEAHLAAMGWLVDDAQQHSFSR